MDTSSLDVFRLGERPPFQPLTSDRLTSLGRVLAFDQSLTATGMVVLEVAGPASCRVLDAQTLGSEQGTDRGHEQSLRRAAQVHVKIDTQVVRWATFSMPCWVAHETPPLAGGTSSKMMRPESSLLAALAVRISARNMLLPIQMVSAQAAKKLICGNANAEKSVAHAALAQHCAPWIQSYELVTNEHKRDALMIALYVLANRSNI